MNTRKLKLIAASAVACTVGVAYLVNAGGVRYGNADMNRLLRASPHFKQPSSYRTVEERQAWLEHNWRFANLWLARNEQDIVPEIIPFLDDPDKDLRERAAKALGRLEDVRAEEPLQQKLEQGQKTHAAPDSIGAADIPSQTLKLALGRIRARDLEGKAKLNKVAESVDLTYQGVGLLAQQLGAKYHSQDPSERRAASGSAAKGIVLEIVDVLYAMGKNGENIAGLKDDNLAFGPAIAMKLKAATLPLDQEIQLILDYSAKPKGGAFNESYLVELGPRHRNDGSAP